MPGIAFASIGILMRLQFLRIFYHGGTLAFGPTLLMIILTLLGSFMAEDWNNTSYYVSAIGNDQK